MSTNILINIKIKPINKVLPITTGKSRLKTALMVSSPSPFQLNTFSIGYKDEPYFDELDTDEFSHLILKHNPAVTNTNSTKVLHNIHISYYAFT